MRLSGKIFFSVITLILLSFSSCSFANEYVRGDVIVVLRNPDSGVKVTASSFGDDGAGTIAAASFARASGASLKKTYPALSEADNNIFALIHSDDIDPEEFTNELLKNPDVIAASPNYTVRAARVPDDNDMYMSLLWGFEAINMPEAWDKETGSSSVYVAVIDSGIDWTNPDLTANVARDLGFTTSDQTSSQAGMDDFGHGTHVAGTVGAVGGNGMGIAGINWSVSMIPVKALDSSGNGSFSGIVEGVNYVASLMSEGYNIRVINLSLAGYIQMTPVHDNLVRFPLWRALKAIDEDNQAVTVIAAGNEAVVVGEPTTSRTSTYDINSYVYPASFIGLNNMISVSAVGASGNIASYSNTNADISAPGGDYNVDRSYILSTWIHDNADVIDDNGIALKGDQGTSMAAPHVAGAVALLSAHAPRMTAYQLKQCILRTASTGGDGAGILDVGAAINYQDTSGSTLQREGTQDSTFNDWRSYNQTEQTSQRKSSSGGCNSFMFGALTVMILFAFTKKSKR